MLNLFDRNEADKMIDRINHLTPVTVANWGKMTVDQMLAHCNVSFDMAFTDKYPTPGVFKKFLLKLFVKSAVVGSKPYPKNSRTAPEFIISSNRDFDAEKQRLIGYINKVQELGSEYFEGRDYRSFGTLTSKEWNMMFSKHLDHHLTQFGV